MGAVIGARTLKELAPKPHSTRERVFRRAMELPTTPRDTGDPL